MRSALQLYAAAVCFVAVGCLAVASGAIAYHAVGSLFPGFMIHPTTYMPPPVALQWNPVPIELAGSAGAPSRGSTPLVVSAEEEAKRLDQARTAAIHAQMFRARQGLLFWGIAALVSALLLVVHWRLLRRAERHVA